MMDVSAGPAPDVIRLLHHPFNANLYRHSTGRFSSKADLLQFYANAGTAPGDGSPGKQPPLAFLPLPDPSPQSTLLHVHESDMWSQYTAHRLVQTSSLKYLCNIYIMCMATSLSLFEICDAQFSFLGGCDGAFQYEDSCNGINIKNMVFECN